MSVFTAMGADPRVIILVAAPVSVFTAMGADNQE